MQSKCTITILIFLTSLTVVDKVKLNDMHASLPLDLDWAVRKVALADSVSSCEVATGSVL